MLLAELHRFIRLTGLLPAAGTHGYRRMRAALIDQVFRADLMIQAFAINAVLFAAAVAVFIGLLNSARKAGTLMQGGEWRRRPRPPPPARMANERFAFQG